LSRFPPILQLNLSRIELDYATWQRKKINDRFEYPLELDLTSYADLELNLPNEDSQYELKSIVVHRGGPYGGHYHALIRDDVGLGVWDLELPN
jgi:ubiquitin C-terminal hydrolase